MEGVFEYRKVASAVGIVLQLELSFSWNNESIIFICIKTKKTPEETSSGVLKAIKDSAYFEILNIFQPSGGTFTLTAPSLTGSSLPSERSTSFADL